MHKAWQLLAWQLLARYCISNKANHFSHFRILIPQSIFCIFLQAKRKCQSIISIVNGTTNMVGGYLSRSNKFVIFQGDNYGEKEVENKKESGYPNVFLTPSPRHIRLMCGCQIVGMNISRRQSGN